MGKEIRKKAAWKTEKLYTKYNLQIQNTFVNTFINTFISLLVSFSSFSNSTLHFVITLIQLFIYWVVITIERQLQIPLNRWNGRLVIMKTNKGKFRPRFSEIFVVLFKINEINDKSTKQQQLIA